MSLERARRSVARLRELAARPDANGTEAPGLDAATALELFESQLLCRLVDVESHELRARGQGHYTICSAGHEGNVALGRLTRPTDPALLHYRSGALFVERARPFPSIDPVRDLLLSLVASEDDPISGGRHKVFGSVPLGIPPQTSTIASHLPRAVGLAASFGIAARLGKGDRPRDALVLCSFGDASVNHSTSQGAFNTAAWMAFQHLPVPILFVCEDNGLGISVRTPPGWVEACLRATPGFAYFFADGSDLLQSYEATRAAIERCRTRRAPVVLHLGCQRMWGHAGSDIDTEYRSGSEISLAEEKDPVLCTARTLIAAGILDGAGLAVRIDAAEARVRAASEDAVRRPRLESRAAIIQPLAPWRPEEVRAEATRVCGAPRADERPRPMGLTIRAALHELCAKYPEMVVFGEDVARKGGVYGVTVGLRSAFGPARVWNTLLDEQTILGVALGAGMAGLLPVPEIQFLAYLHNAEDQLRGEAATQSFFSNGQIRSPMVVRIPGLAYQKGFGGHFHNDDSLAVLRDIPGVIVAVPSRGDDAVRMLRTLVAAAKVDGRVCVFVEPIALYPVRDLYAEGDAEWCFSMPPEGEAIDVGAPGVYGPEDRSLAIVTYGNGVPMSLRARRRLGLEGIAARVVDLRWIAPLAQDEIRRHARETGHVLVVDECRRSGNVSEAIGTCLLEDASTCAVRFARVTAADSFVPLGAAATLVLPSEEEIVHCARRLVQPTAVG
ncbi:MAG: MFS transporter [Deltaproteobacteria bacterium]|nr:MFS transporter [Deltaproteobacteria bacterium]